MSPRSRTLSFGLRRLVVRRQGGTLAEEVFLRLVEQDLVRLLAAAGQAILVHDHFEMLQPHLPRLLRDAVVDALAKLVRERLVLEPRQLALELDALEHPRHRHLRIIVYHRIAQSGCARDAARPVGCSTRSLAVIRWDGGASGGPADPAVPEPPRLARLGPRDGRSLESWAAARHRGHHRSVPRRPFSASVGGLRAVASLDR